MGALGVSDEGGGGTGATWGPLPHFEAMGVSDGGEGKGEKGGSPMGGGGGGGKREPRGDPSPILKPWGSLMGGGGEMGALGVSDGVGGGNGSRVGTPDPF